MHLIGMKLNEFLKGPYGGLFGEVVTEDCYRLRSVKFQPTLIFDIGANIGIFSRFARTLFPKASIVALEPDENNCAYFRDFTFDSNIHLIQKALGRGRIFHGTTAANGSGETYLSAGLGYPGAMLNGAASLGAGLEYSNVESVTLGELAGEWLTPKDSLLIKIDCEGAENTIWDDPASMEVLKRAGYIAAELHFYAMDGSGLEEVREQTLQGLDELNATHLGELNHIHYWATRRR